MFHVLCIWKFHFFRSNLLFRWIFLVIIEFSISGSEVNPSIFCAHVFPCFFNLYVSMPLYGKLWQRKIFKFNRMKSDKFIWFLVCLGGWKNIFISSILNNIFRSNAYVSQIARSGGSHFRSRDINKPNISIAEQCRTVILS